jgi:hypothetical protein
MQRNRSESLLNALVLSVALIVSYAAPRLAAAPEERHVAAPARSINLRALERSIASGDDDDDDDDATSDAGDEGGFGGNEAVEQRIRRKLSERARGARVRVR